MAILTAAKKALLNKMNRHANKAGLGDLLGVNVLAAGTHTTSAGVTQTIAVTGAAAGDFAIVQVKTRGAVPRVVEAASVGSGAITVTMSGDPAADHVLQYVVIRNV